MALLAGNKLKKSFAQRILFEDVSFEIQPKDRIGLIGANGTGKTTLLKILLGLEQADEGQVYQSRETTIGCLEQTPDLDMDKSVYDVTLSVFAPLLEMEQTLIGMEAQMQSAKGDALTALIEKQHRLQDRFEQEGGLTCKSRVRATLLGLGFTKEELDKPIGVLSGGQLNKVMLSRVLLSGSNLLFLDEPTNHLDVEAVEWLEGFLVGYPGAFLVISHDRYFLDRVTNRTMELKNGRMYTTKGNYSRHVELRSTEAEIALRHYRNTQREIKRIYGIVEQQRRWNRERNIRTAESKLKQIDRLKATLVEPEQETDNIRFSFRAKEPGGNEVLLGKGLKKSFDGKTLFENTELLLRKNERVFLLGPNGCGKTTLLKMLIGREPYEAGNAVLGAKVEAAYYEQNMRSLHPDNTVEEEIWNAYPKLGKTEVRNALAAFLFRGDGEVSKPIRLLSGGERARVQLLKLMLSGANLLLLDEPTNHLDIASLEALENALEDYGGTLLIVTHDRYLVNRLADRTLYMQKDGLIESIGGYGDLLSELDRRKSESACENREQKKPNDYKAQKERQSAINKATGAVTRAEAQIKKAEEAIRLQEQALSLCASDYVKAGALSAKIDTMKEELGRLYEKWEQAEERLSQLTAQTKEE